MLKTTVVGFARPILLIVLLLAGASIATHGSLPVLEASTGGAPVPQSQVVGQGPNRAGIVVRFDDGRVETRCVAFGERAGDEIGGDELLAISGLTDVVIAPEGTVCRIDGLGCDPEDCFCQCPFPECLYWAYYHRQDSNWLYSQQGAVYTIVRNGDVEGWSWGQGDFQSGVEPPPINFDDICTPDGQAATATATTGSDRPSGGPEVTFSAVPTAVTAGQCSVLTWQSIDATSITLDGESVELSGSRRVCPPSTNTWTLLASNSAGETTSQVSVQVSAAGAVSTLQPGTTAQPTSKALQLASPTPVQRAIAGQTRQALPTAVQGEQPGTVGTPVAPVPAAETVLAPAAGQVAPFLTPLPVSTATRYVFSPPPTVTPRPRRELSAGGRPTPTAILVARAAGGSGQAPAARAGAGPAMQPTGRQQLAESRAFSAELIPGYIAYFVSLLILLLMGWYVLRRRNGVTTSAVGQRADEEGREALTARRE